MDDPIRYPEPPDRPEPGAQWDEVRGVWELWNEETELWEEVTEAIAGRGVGMAGDRAAPVGAIDLHLELSGSALNHEQRADHLATEGRFTGVGGDVARVSMHAAALDRLDDERDQALDEIYHAPANPDGTRYPEPVVRPDRQAQWDESIGVWRIWDAEQAEWLPWSPDTSTPDVGTPDNDPSGDGVEI